LIIEPPAHYSIICAAASGIINQHINTPELAQSEFEQLFTVPSRRNVDESGAGHSSRGVDRLHCLLGLFNSHITGDDSSAKGVNLNPIDR
jgi:hypothetical protein